MKYLIVLIFIFSVIFNVYLYRNYIKLQTKLELSVGNSNISSIGLVNNKLLAESLKLLNSNFVKTNYHLGSLITGKNVDMKYLCDQSNGIYCVYYDSKGVVHEYSL